ncbi:hypothetical protein GF378_02400 [Candidatus Pacearchaeota archaeon]|nr:hypothetical protein [Candidatus Pacearchaeota archaeon]
MTEIKNLTSRKIPKEIALPARPRIKYRTAGSDIDINVSVDYAVLTDRDIENYIERGDYNADENIIDNEYLDNYTFLKDEINLPKTISKNAYPLKERNKDLERNIEDPTDESFQKGLEKQKSRKTNRSYWEPVAFVYGAKRASKTKGKWVSNENVVYQEPKTNDRNSNIKYKNKSLFQKLISWAF